MSTLKQLLIAEFNLIQEIYRLNENELYVFRDLITLRKNYLKAETRLERRSLSEQIIQAKNLASARTLACYYKTNVITKALDMAFPK